jgi:hypothetical protein
MNNRFINPPSTAPISEFSASTFNALKQLIDATEIPASYLATIAANINGQDFVVRPANAAINSETTYDFTIKVPMPIPVGSTFVLSIPSEISIYSKSG